MEFDQTNWVPVQRRGPLPTYYYHEHFREMLDFVSAHYAHVLAPGHQSFINEFAKLPLAAQRLYVRLVNRKGRIFAANRLRYPEIGDLPSVIATLRRDGWVGSPVARHFDDVLQFLTRKEILQVLQAICPGTSRSLKKAALIEMARQYCDRTTFIEHLDTDRLLLQRRAEEVRYVLFLYFGRVQDGLSQFTMRDLGLVRTHAFKDTYEPRFLDPGEAFEHYFYASRLHELEKASSACLQKLASGVADWPEPDFSGSAAIRDRFAFRLGRKLEADGDSQSALCVYRKGESAKCSEKVIRLMFATCERDEVQSYLEACLENPRSDEEWLIASDIYERKFRKKRTSSLTDLLRSAAILDLDESNLGAPENAAVRHYADQGCPAYRTENAIWRSFFGLLFWDQLFLGNAATLHSPFEILPACLSDGSFRQRFADAIDQKLFLLDKPGNIKKPLLKTMTKYYGTSNGVFRWRRPVLDAVFALIDVAPADAMRRMLERFCDDFKASRYGYPDLMLVEKDSVRFIEIKAEGDQLRRNQLLRIEQLRAAGFSADVVRVRWVLDPHQVYVVVDVETTGGRGEHHRVTEIGAVKIQNGKVTDRFQTLLNPQRSIPPAITRLTGITPGMVANAPCFPDVADDFAEFLGDAIFVAHNVEFDYRFIAREFSRLGRPFRHAKLCTCASMRKLYPGHRSYSLGALCRAYDITLKQHHRALCDAEAAAELLLLINEKRQDKLAASA